MQNVILITGGSRGLGRNIVEKMLHEGHIVATFSRSSSDFIQETLQKYPQTFVWQSIDGSNFEAVENFARGVDKKFGRIDVLINNAGVVTESILTFMSKDNIRKQINLNLESNIYLTRTCLKSMLRSKKGCIINISSVNAVQGNSGVSVYSATKAGIDGMTRSLAREYGPTNIRVNSVAPGYFESEMSSILSDEERARIIRRTPLKRLGQIEDITGIICFLMSEAASFITGQTFVIDGGLSC